MSDVSDGSGPVPRRSPRVGEGPAPISGALAIILAVAALLIGFFVLKTISDDGDNSIAISPRSDAGDQPAASTPEATSSEPPSDGVGSLPSSTVAAQPAIVTSGATVVVANANGKSGSAKKMSDALALGPGFVMGEPKDAADSIGDLEATQIYYASDQLAAKSVADSLVIVLGGGIQVAPMPATPPVKDGDIAGAGVLLMLGLDRAEKTLAELNPATATATPATNPPSPLATTTLPSG